MRFGLERMRRLLTALGSPQERFRAVHVVGTNGKSSTVRFTAALLEAHGVRTGSYLSPHLTSYAERIRIGDADLSARDFGAAIQRAAVAAAKVDRTLTGGERVTQFELLTAAAFSELARREVEVAVIEAGLGGRWDATNVLGAPVVVLTNVGPRAHALARADDRRHRGGEARGRPARRDPGAGRRVARGRGARPRDGREDRAAARRRRARRRRGARGALPGYQRRNFAAAAGRRRGAPRAPARPGARRRRRRRAQRSRTPAGRRARAADDLRRCPQRARHRRARGLGSRRHGRGAVNPRRQGRRRDAARAAAATSAAVFTCAPNPRALPPATLADLASKVGGVQLGDRTRSAPRRRARAGTRRAERHGARDRIDLSRGRAAQRPGERRASAL